MLWGRKPLGTVAYMGGVPAVLESFCWAWGQMVQYNQELLCGPQDYIHYARATFSDHAPARNSLVSAFLGDWLVQMDTDHRFDPDIVGRLLRIADQYQVDVVTALYQMKGPPHVAVAWMGDPMQPVVKLHDPVPALLSVQSAGAGCLFVRRSVFDRLAKAFPGVGPFDRIGIQSEDHSFFQRCREAGIACYLAPHIHSAHLRVAPVDWTDCNTSGISMREQSIDGMN